MAIIDDLASLATVFISASRSIGAIIPDIVLEEHHRDEVAVTQHPVEIGATITDHAFKLPAQLEMRVSYSDAETFPGFSKAAYAAFLALQEARQPMVVSTGKRLYKNMLITGLVTGTDHKTENALLLAVRMQEINLVSVQTSAGSGRTGPTAGGTNADQGSPAATASVADAGSRTLKVEPSTGRVVGTV